MVLYWPDGRVVRLHEEYLEQKAAKNAKEKGYTEQIEVARKKDPKACDVPNLRVHIVVDQQFYQELYQSEFSDFTGQYLSAYNVDAPSDEIPHEGLDRRTLMRCCSTADEFFTFEPNATILHLPVCYKKDTTKVVKDDQMAYIREKELVEFIFPWLEQMEQLLQRPHKVPVNELPKVEIPPDLREKIHLYNVMLQLGIASYFQRPLVDAIILQMYQTNLNRCQLDTLEMTVGRFYSRGVAILDPVINHLIGTYSFRSAADRQNPRATDDTRILSDENHAEDTEREHDERYWPAGTTRQWLTYSSINADRLDYPDDIVSLPPRLEVLGHSIRHWSGLRRNGSTAAAHTGFPLNVGRVLKYYRRRATSPIRKGPNIRAFNFADFSTHRLKHVEHFHRYAPGSLPEEPTGGADPRNEEPPPAGDQPKTPQDPGRP